MAWIYNEHYSYHIDGKSTSFTSIKTEFNWFAFKETFAWVLTSLTSIETVGRYFYMTWDLSAWIYNGACDCLWTHLFYSSICHVLKIVCIFFSEIQNVQSWKVKFALLQNKKRSWKIVLINFCSHVLYFELFCPKQIYAA